MGFCSKRHFLLTICTLQLITTTERQVFDFLGYMWVPILVNFFNVIFVIFGFFGALQYRSKYIITYCVWNVIWLAWNVFLSCFYLDAGGLDKTTDLLNFGTGSFSWWLINGPGCNPYFNRTIDRPDFTRPERPDSVTGCVLDYEIVEVVHSSIQCLLSIMAIISGIFLSRAYMEEDDSFDFVGGGDFGMAGHTPLHPMYVSYSALPPAAAGHKQSAGNESYYYPTNTGTTAASGRSSSSNTLISPLSSGDRNNPMYNNNKISLPLPLPQPQRRIILRPTEPEIIDGYRHNPNIRPTIIDYSADYSNPIDELPRTHLQHHRQPDYDTLETHTPNLSMNRAANRFANRPLPPVTYSPLLRNRQFARAVSHQGTNSNSRSNNRNSYRPRLHADHIREQPSPLPHSAQPPQPLPGLRSFHSDPRLAMEDHHTVNASPLARRAMENRGARVARREARPMSMFVNNY